MTTITSPAGIQLFRLLSLRGALKLETKGIKRSRRPSINQLVKDEFNLPKNYKAKDTLFWLNDYINRLYPERTRQCEQNPSKTDSSTSCESSGSAKPTESA